VRIPPGSKPFHTACDRGDGDSQSASAVGPTVGRRIRFLKQSPELRLGGERLVDSRCVEGVSRLWIKPCVDASRLVPEGTVPVVVIDRQEMWSLTR